MNLPPPVHCGERVDDLLIGGLRIIQRPEEFCFTLDSVLLAQFAFLRAGASAVDLGSGSGAIALLLAARGATVTGVELNPRLADMAERSVRLNQLEARVAIHCHDLRRISDFLPAGSFSLVVSNPPYRASGRGQLNPCQTVASARHELTATLADVIAAARYLVKYRGRFALVQLPERMAEILKTMSDAGLEPKRLRLVYPYQDAKPKFLLVEGIRGARPGLDVLPPLFVYSAPGVYSREIMEYYQAEGVSMR
ncbi:MAG: tRNA1(Val) (adenine(37)-N6)-methyltransferase [Sporomusaceae bacterium]|nr:tRNA1(Val) (adenine(37)-N6)-methyltransferase [Sporomusaceae bacterium]